MLPGFKASTTIRTEILDAAVRLVFSDLELRYKSVPLTELAFISSGGTPLRGNSVFYGGDIPWAKIGDLTAAGKWISSTEESITAEALQNSAAKLFPSGTVLYSMYGSIGKAAITTKTLATNQAILGLVPKNDIDPEYLYYCLIYARLALFFDAKGTSQKNINAKMVKEFIVPMPPTETINSVVYFLSAIEDGKNLSELTDLPQFISESRRIVARIEGLAARIEEAQKLRRQAAEEAEVLIGATTKHFFDLNGAKHLLTTLGKVTTRITKGESPSWQGFSYQDHGPLFVRSENVLWGRLDLSKRVCIPEAFHQKLSRSKLQDRDVLINLVGASIGRACVVPENIGDANINQAVALISPNPRELNSEYLMKFLISTPTQEVIHGGKVETARPNISLGDLRKLIIPLPHLDEQHRIVAYLNKLQAKTDALKKYQARTGEELDALLPSVLDRAFRGEL